jgi:hypothetical protein
MAGSAVQWPVFGLADVSTDRSVSRPEDVAESGTAQDVSEAGHGDGLGLAAPRSVGPIGNSAPVSIIRRAPPTSASYFLISPHRKRTKPSPSSTAPSNPPKLIRAFPRVPNELTSIIRSTARQAGSSDLPGRFNATPDSGGPSYVEHSRGGLFQDGVWRLNSLHSPIHGSRA